MKPRKSPWPLIGAVVISAALHAMVISGVKLRLPEKITEPAVIEARLAPAPLPPQAAAQPAPPTPVQHAKRIRPAVPHRAPPPVLAAPRTAPDAAAELAMRDEAPEPLSQAPAVEPPVSMPAPEPPAQVAMAPSTTLEAPEPPPLRLLPRRGRISYTLYLGTDRFEIGRTVQNWEFEDGKYRIGSTSETTGLAAVVRSERRTYLSEGTINASGLKPQSFLMSRQRRSDIEVARARFDWNAAQITWGTTDEKNEAALPPNAQDFLSLMYQFALAPPKSGRIAVPATTGTKFEIYELDVLPEETIDTPLGPLRALPLKQVRRPNAETIEIWLATEYRYLPVKLRFFGRDGKPTGEQVVNEIRLAEDRAPASATGIN